MLFVKLLNRVGERLPHVRYCFAVLFLRFGCSIWRVARHRDLNNLRLKLVQQRINDIGKIMVPVIAFVSHHGLQSVPVLITVLSKRQLSDDFTVIASLYVPANYRVWLLEVRTDVEEAKYRDLIYTITIRFEAGGVT